MPSRCAVAECKISLKNKENLPNLVLHRFPVHDEDILKKWTVSCKRKDKFNPKTSYLCSEHFEAECYERDLQNELLGYPIRKKLKRDAVPTIFNTRPPKQSQSAKAREQRHKKREWETERSKIVTNLINERILIDEQTPSEPTPEQIKITSLSTSLMDLQKKQKDLENKHESLLKVLERKTRRIAVLVAKNKSLKNRVKSTLAKLQVKDNIVSSFRKKSPLTRAQQQKLQGKKRVNWTNEDIVKALAVRSTSLKSYETARKVWKLPLPSPRCLRDYTQRFACNPGMLEDVIEVLKSEASQFSLIDRVCALSFDEMALCSKFVVERSTHAIMSGSKAQVVLARGLCNGWKQPIFYDFDTKMTKSILFEIIAKLESCGYPVHAVTCDLGADNRSLLTSLGIKSGQSSFVNPVNAARRIHVFGDIPHMIKLMRNHVLDEGLVLDEQAGTVLNKATFQKLIQSDNTEIKRCPKLSQKLIDVSGSERMRVRFAAQLFSHHVATLAKEVFSDISVSNFISTVNDGFDVLNSRIPIDSSNPLKSGFGMNFKQQSEALYKLRKILSMRFLTKAGNEKRVLHPFQEYWITSIDSTFSLYSDLIKLYNISYLLVSRVHQDSLESFFSMIRAYGGPNCNPTVVEFKYRLRLLLIGSHVRAPKGTNTEEVYEGCNWISAELIKSNKLNRNSNLGQISKTIMPQLSSTSFNFEQIEYLAGYIAYRLRQKGLAYGLPSYKTMGKTWVHLLSKGGLQVPSTSFTFWIKRCNDIFENYVNKNPIISGNWKESICSVILEELPDIDENIVKCFVGVRINIRVNYLNQKMSSETGGRKKRIKNAQFAKSKQ